MLRLGYLSYRPSLIEKKLKWIAKIEITIIEIIKIVSIVKTSSLNDTIKF